MESGECLIARASDNMRQETDISSKLEKLALDEKSSKDETKEKGKSTKTNTTRLSPAEYFQLQSLKSSALAGHTKTTTKFGGTGPELYSALLTKANSTPEPTNEPALPKPDSPPDPDLLDRGPIKGTTKTNYTAFPYPYPPGNYHQTTLYRPDLPGTAPAAFVPDQRCYRPNNYGPYQGLNFTNGLMEGKTEGWIAGPERVSPDTADYQMVPQAFVARNDVTEGLADQVLSADDINRLLQVPKELPDALSDFILKYSRRYSLSSVDRQSDSGRSSSRKSSVDSTSSSPRHLMATRALSSDDNACDSPMSAGSAPRASPNAPNEGQTPGTPTNVRITNGKHRLKTLISKEKPSNAKERMRLMFTDKQMDEAWAWTCKCTQSCPGALFYRDPDGDSLLHIVVWHRDLPKVFALAEQMQQKQLPVTCLKPFDMPNRMNETPLFLAVEKRAEEIVSYLLEVGANPNVQTGRTEGDTALHYAAARGMTEIVQTLSANSATNFNVPNAFGLTPLLCAVKNHGVIEEDSQCLVNNKPTIRALLKAGADAKIADATNGKSVLHYAVERMDPELVEIFRSNLDPDSMCQLSNLSCFNDETPVQLLNRLGTGMHTGLGRVEAEDELRRKMFLTLLTCGADVPGSPEHEDQTLQKLGLKD